MQLLHLLQFQIRFTQPVTFHFFHHPALYAALLDRLGNPPLFPKGAALYCPERGRVQYNVGEEYHFGLALLPTAEITALDWMSILQRPPRTPYGRSNRAPFGNSFEIIAVKDLIENVAIKQKTPHPLTRQMLNEAVRRLAQCRELTLQFLSPLLILRAPVATKQYIMDGEQFAPVKLLQRVVQTTTSWWPDLPSLPDPTGEPVELVENRLIRADVTYPKKRLLGAIGKIRLHFRRGVGPWALPLLLAGMVGVGKARNMGQGRFVVHHHPLPISWPPKPARTILQTAADGANLSAAREEIATAGAASGIDEQDRSEFLDTLTFRLPKIAGALATGKLRPDPLKGLVIRETGDDDTPEKLRPLAIPTQRDRFAQRAVLQVLAPAAEQLWEDSSYAYRKGLSHRTAQRSVARAQRDGFTHVLDADISAFFDEVDWDKLTDRLEGFWGDDPVVELLLTWVKAPVIFEGKKVIRHKGLPQGAVISPLLSNLYLDALDESIDRAGFRLVRYADDFVVLGKSSEQVEQAKQLVTEELHKLGLALNEEKTQITSFEKGFQFLGVFFCRSVVLEVKQQTNEVRAVLDRLPRQGAKGEPLPLKGWLNDFFRAQATAKAAEQASELRHFRPALLPPSAERQAVYIVSRGVSLTGRKRGLQVDQPGKRPQLIGWREISEIVVLGGRHVRSSVIQRAMVHRVPVAFHKWDGTPVGLVLPDKVRSPSPTTLRQWQWATNSENALAVARALVEAKIRNVRLFVRRRGKTVSKLREELKRLGNRAQTATNIKSLTSIEGQAAHAYFAFWPRWLNTALDPFPGRKTKGAGDPINVLLNLLYTQLFRLTHTTILAAGLDPYLGVLHDGKGRYAALAADLMEPFRFLVDRVVIDLVNHSRIRPDSFHRPQKGPYRLKLKPETVKALIAEYENQLLRQVADTNGRKESYRGHLFRQAQSLVRLIQGKDQSFQAFRMKW